MVLGHGHGGSIKGASHGRRNCAYCPGVLDLKDGDDVAPATQTGAGFFGVELMESIQSAIRVGSNFTQLSGGNKESCSALPTDRWCGTRFARGGSANGSVGEFLSQRGERVLWLGSGGNIIRAMDTTEIIQAINAEIKRLQQATARLEGTSTTSKRGKSRQPSPVERRILYERTRS